MVLEPTAVAQAERRLVYVAPIEGIIDLGLAPFVQRILDEAAGADAAAAVLEGNTFGGRVDAAVQIRDALLGARVPTVAYVNRRAISAGALISLAAEHLVMAPGVLHPQGIPRHRREPQAPAAHRRGNGRCRRRNPGGDRERQAPHPSPPTRR
jgi:hypothetical protein